MSNATPALRLYAILLSADQIAWLDKWLNAGVSAEPEQAGIIEIMENALSRIKSENAEKRIKP